MAMETGPQWSKRRPVISETIRSGALVTVGIPAFNAEATLADSIASVTSQSHRNLEILLFDNGSTDGTAQICVEAEAADSRITLLRSEENLGLAHSFETLLRAASGTYFMWAAADDFRPPDFIAEGVAHLEANPEASLSAPVAEGYVDGIEHPIFRAVTVGMEPGESTTKRLCGAMRSLPATAIYGVYRTEKAVETLGFRKSMATDLAFLFEIVLRGHVVSNPRQILVFNRRRRWNTLEEDYRTFTGISGMPRFHLPFVHLFADRARRILHLEVGPLSKLWFVALLSALEIRRLAFMATMRILNRFISQEAFTNVAVRLHCRFVHTANYEILDHEVYRQRMIVARYLR